MGGKVGDSEPLSPPGRQDRVGRTRHRVFGDPDPRGEHTRHEVSGPAVDVALRCHNHRPGVDASDARLIGCQRSHRVGRLQLGHDVEAHADIDHHCPEGVG